MTEAPAVVWFRRDLRLADNPALDAAVKSGSSVVPVFIWALEEDERWPPGSASRWWLHQSLTELSESLSARGSRLILRSGPTKEALLQLAAESGAKAFYWSRQYEPAAIARDRELKALLRGQGFAAESFPGNLLFEPWTIQNKNREPIRVFTAFWKTCLKASAPPMPLEIPPRIPAPREWPKSLPLSQFALEATIDWAAGMREAWRPGELGAAENMEVFLQRGLAQYATERERPGHTGTSRLSPHLHFGEISARQVWHSARRRIAETDSDHPSMEAFLSEIGWREFAHHLLFHYPNTATDPLRPEFALFPWQFDAVNLKAWTRGRTGYPLVDAGMRELWRTGWMHNRVRMVAASFLVKHLLIPWQEGAAWFWDTLVDADLANNTLGWQWVAGCGADSAPYFRIFNPVLQGERFDPKGDYVRHWVPELARLPAAWIHKPWEAPESLLVDAGVKLGETYPQPIVMHKEARDRALAALASLRKGR